MRPAEPRPAWPSSSRSGARRALRAPAAPTAPWRPAAARPRPHPSSPAYGAPRRAPANPRAVARPPGAPQTISSESEEEEDNGGGAGAGVFDPFAAIAPYAPAAVRHHRERHVVFAIPPATLETPVSDVLPCPSLRHLPALTPRPNPLLPRLDRGIVDDGDRVALNTISYGGGGSGGLGTAAGVLLPLAVEGPADAEAIEAVAAAVAAHAPTEAAEEAGQHILKSRHGHYIELPPLPGQPKDSRRVVVPLPTFAMRSGARETVYFDPAQTTAAIVTAGSICPGMNDVVSAMVQRLTAYGVPEGQILGIRYGFEGFTSGHGTKPLPLCASQLDTMHLSGGSCLGSSSPLSLESDASLRQRMTGVAQKLKDWGINMLFVIGGEGGNILGADLARWCALNEVPCAVVGVPKSIDNDMLLLDRSFGFDTAVERAQLPLTAAHTEAASALNGIGIVKLFGRRSGFLTMQASLASGLVDVCLVPEVPIDVPMLLAHLRGLLEDKGHVVVCVAEGAGQELLFPDGHRDVDSQGNPVLGDIGAHLKALFKASLEEVDVKFIDPTHLVEATASSASDHVLAKTLGHHAVDAAFAGYTGVMCGVVNGHHALLPAHVVTQSWRSIHPGGKAYNRLRESTGQPF